MTTSCCQFQLCLRMLSAIASVLVSASAPVAATEVDFWQAYRGADEATYLLGTFDDESLPVGSADVQLVEKIGTPTLVAGKFATALQLNSHDGLKLKTARIYPGGDLSIEAWIRLDDYPTERGYILHRPAVVDHDARYDPQRDTTKGFALWVDHQGALHLETTNCFYGSAVHTFSPAAAVAKSHWVHVAATSNGFPNSYRRLFVDGHEVASAAITWGQGLMVQNDEESKPADMIIGNDATGEKGIAGQIDQLRIHRQIVRFWPNEEEPWTRSNVPNRLSSGPPHFLSRHEPTIFLPLNGNKVAQGPGAAGLQILGGEQYVNGVCSQALVGSLELRGPNLLDLQEGTLEFWLRPIGVNSYSDCNYGFVNGPFIFYIYNSGGLANKPLALYFRKDDGDLLMLRAEDTVLHPGRWYHFAITWHDDEITIYGDGQRLAKSFGVPLVTRQNHGTCGQLVLGAGESLLDEVRLYTQALESEEVANAYLRYREPTRLIAAVDRPLRLRAQYFPSQHQVFYRLAANVNQAEIARVVLTLHEVAGPVLSTSEHPFTTDEQTLKLPDLPDGRYELAASAIGSDGSVRSGEVFSFRRQHYPWEDNQLGITDQVYPPFEPIRVEERSVNVVGRRYQLGTLGFPEQITSDGRDILAGPIVLRYETREGEGTWNTASGEFTQVQPSQVVFEGRTEGPAVVVDARCQIEIDGCMKVELDLLPGDESTEIQRMWLEIPLNTEAVPLMHTVTAGLHRTTRALFQREPGSCGMAARLINTSAGSTPSCRTSGSAHRTAVWPGSRKMIEAGSPGRRQKDACRKSSATPIVSSCESTLSIRVRRFANRTDWYSDCRHHPPNRCRPTGERVCAMHRAGWRWSLGAAWHVPAKHRFMTTGASSTRFWSLDLANHWILPGSRNMLASTILRTCMAPGHGSTLSHISLAAPGTAAPRNRWPSTRKKCAAAMLGRNGPYFRMNGQPNRIATIAAAYLMQSMREGTRHWGNRS